MFLKRNVAESAKNQLNNKEMCAVLWATKGLAFELIQDPIFKAQFGPCIPAGLDRGSLVTEMKQLAAKVDAELYNRMKGCTVTMGVDGWTNTRHR